ncbi:hypothetical protein ACQR1N_20420 [Bradyrhizobium sp. HKCCYLRH1073]|uniref:hypothetical protein n=1 Tax=unclassified Bradyrhizobium TaxID=2631580 RepID=UPI003EBDD176
MALRQSITKRLMLARYLFGQSKDAVASNREVATFAAINLLQDAIEIFFLAAADHLNAEISRRTEFEQYLDKVNEKLEEPLPFRQRLIEINKVRVLSKHNGIPPNRTELIGYVEDARQFFEEACEKLFHSSFWTISLIELLSDGEPRQFLTAAEKFYNEREYYSCLIECRKAIYVEIESDYTIEIFEHDDISGALFAATCKAPSHTKSRRFIDQYVRDPFDYIQLDRRVVEAELLRDGIEPAIFWNIWRLTPPVYRARSPFNKGDFNIRHDPERYDNDAAEPSAAYVLEHTIDILLRKDKTRNSFKTIEADTNYVSRPKNGRSFKVYRKADKSSEVVGEVPGTAERVVLKYWTPGLRGGSFWLISFMDGLEDGVGPGVDIAFSGYADQNDLACGGPG